MNKSSLGFVDAVKDFVGFGDIDYEEEMEYEEYEEQEERAPLFAKKNKVVALDRASAQPSIVVLKPKCFNNTTEVADQIKQRRPVILDVGNLDPEEARRVVDFVAGTVYGLGGDATDKNAAKKIYEAKGRPSNNPLIIHVASPEDAEKLVDMGVDYITSNILE